MSKVLKAVLFAGLVLLAMPAISQDAGSIEERFSAFDPDSSITVNHTPLSSVLSEIIFPVGYSRAKLGMQGKTTAYTGSRIVSTPSGKPSRYEGNRLMIHAFDDGHEAFFEGYQQGLETLSERRPLSTLNKDEQLAYWLNLYNVIVINNLIDEYPIKKLKLWRISKKGGVFWDQKITRVEGVPLSLRDIELIVFNNWESPLVMYGLFQGSIGGPSLYTEAFTGDNVWRLLNEAAIEFVNSNRGVRVKGSRADVSLLYEWALPLFDYSEARILTHLKTYEDPDFHGNLSSVSAIRFKNYNWLVADLVGGTLHKGQHSQLGGVLVAGSGRDPGAAAVGRDPGKVNIETHNTFGRGGPSDPTSINLAREITGFNDLLNGTLSRQLSSAQTVLPPQALELIGNVMIHNILPERIPQITITDCEQEGGCIEVPVSSETQEDSTPDASPEPDGPNQMVLIAGLE